MLAWSERSSRRELAEQGRTVFVNDALCLLSGYSREELLHLPPSQVLPAAEDDQVGVSEGYLRHKSGLPLAVEVEALARTDALTGVANRRVWDEELPKELSRALPTATRVATGC